MDNLEESLGLNCVALYKAAKIKGKNIPDERVHVYLAGLITRFENPSPSFSKFVVNSIEDLKKSLESHGGDDQPNAMPYLISKYSGDYSTNMSAQVPGSFDSLFPATCYSLAQYHSRKMGKSQEALIFGLLALNPEEYISLLSSYYHMTRFQDLEVTDEDFNSFKEELKNKFGEKKLVLNIKPVKKKSVKKFLI
jgi:hypothetical protein